MLKSSGAGPLWVNSIRKFDVTLDLNEIRDIAGAPPVLYVDRLCLFRFLLIKVLRLVQSHPRVPKLY